MNSSDNPSRVGCLSPFIFNGLSGPRQGSARGQAKPGSARTADSSVPASHQNHTKWACGSLVKRPNRECIMEVWLGGKAGTKHALYRLLYPACCYLISSLIHTSICFGIRLLLDLLSSHGNDKAMFESCCLKFGY
jgi:hypothetical protein